MCDVIIYNCNNLSILFYECGNELISCEYMIEMKVICDKYDFYGGCVIGFCEMFDICEVEYGGEMFYINKSKYYLMWVMEYCCDEGLCKYWDEYFYLYYKNGEGNNLFCFVMINKVQKKVDVCVYNYNQDFFIIENVICWFDYWCECLGIGDCVSLGGVKIIFLDMNIYYCGVENYCCSGVIDVMCIFKDFFYVYQVMWDGWVDIENFCIYIVGYWNYKEDVVKFVYVVFSVEKVELFLNGKFLGNG